jgi:hypothetical protein
MPQSNKCPYLELDDQHQDSSLSVNVDYDYTTRSSTKRIDLSMGQSQDEARDRIFPTYRADQSTNTP